MMKKIFAATTIIAFGLGLPGCSAKITTGTNTAGTTTAATNSAKPGNSSETKKTDAKTTAAKNDGKTKPALTDEKKPDGKAKTQGKKIAVPDNWVYVYDEQKGYGFSVPEGSTGGQETVEGVDTFVGATPSPTEAAMFVIAFNDKKMTKEDLLNVAVKFLEEMGETVKPGTLSGESDDYAVADATSTSNEGGKSKWKILVGTDVTDNYVMLVGTEESKFDAHKDIIDGIWGSFEMWSGGASGNS
jgi:hypothetical protein